MGELYSNEYNRFIGFEILEMSSTYSKSRVKYDERLLNNYGSIHGGALLSFVDVMAGATASMSGYYVTTVSANLNFLLPAVNTEYIYCECMKLKTGKHILVFDIRITDDAGNLLDSGEITEDQLDAKVKRILTLKYQSGVITDSSDTTGSDSTAAASTEATTAATESADMTTVPTE